MIVLVKNHAGCYAVKSFGMFLKIFIKKMNGDRFFSQNIFSYFWNTEAALIVRPFFAISFLHFCIDENAFISVITRIIIFFIFFKIIDNLDTIHYKQTNVFIYLWGGQTHAFTIVHSFPHIFNQFLQTWITRRNIHAYFS